MNITSSFLKKVFGILILLILANICFIQHITNQSLTVDNKELKSKIADNKKRVDNLLVDVAIMKDKLAEKELEIAYQETKINSLLQLNKKLDQKYFALKKQYGLMPDSIKWRYAANLVEVPSINPITTVARDSIVAKITSGNACIEKLSLAHTVIAEGAVLHGLQKDVINTQANVITHLDSTVVILKDTEATYRQQLKNEKKQHRKKNVYSFIKGTVVGAATIIALLIL